METLIKQKETITWKGNTHQYNGHKVINDTSIDIYLDVKTIRFTVGQVTINNTLCNSMQEIINCLNNN